MHLKRKILTIILCLVLCATILMFNVKVGYSATFGNTD